MGITIVSPASIFCLTHGSMVLAFSDLPIIPSGSRAQPWLKVAQPSAGLISAIVLRSRSNARTIRSSQRLISSSIFSPVTRTNAPANSMISSSNWRAWSEARGGGMDARRGTARLEIVVLGTTPGL